MVGVLSMLALGNRVGDVEFASSGRLAESEAVTENLTLLSFVVGLGLCAPWVASKLRGRTDTTKTWLFFGIVVGIGVHFVAVFGLRLLTYLQMGGIWP
jgi:hypothetical protein